MDAVSALKDVLAALEKPKPLAIATLDAEKTALIVVDMINGFAVKGALASPRVDAISDEVTRLTAACLARHIPVVATADRHTGDSAEFASYPQHCLCGTEETELIEPLKKLGGYTLIYKNSTNSFLEDDFRRWLGNHPQTDTFIIAGDCTDICVLQLALTLKADFNRLDRRSRVVVSKDATATYDAPAHNAELCEAMALYNMTINGIEVVGRIS